MSVAVKSPALKCQLQSKVPRSKVSCGQKSCGQMSVAIKRPAVKCQLQSNIPRSNVSCGQKSRGQMSVVVKCPWSKVLRSNVRCGQMSQNFGVFKSPQSDDPVVIWDPLVFSALLSAPILVLMSPLFINQPLFLQKTKLLYPNPKYLFGIWIWTEKN